MGIGFTIDTPVKVAHLGISSVISIVDDILLEKMREFYSESIGEPFHSISDKMEDFRAERVTAYLNLVDKIVKDKFDNLKASLVEKGSDIEKYFDLLPDLSDIKQKFLEVSNGGSVREIKEWINEHMNPGTIDVNIMTKLDKVNYANGEALPSEFNDAHAALRGFAKSTLSSNVILSAGMNPRLYGYIEQFEDFYPNEETGDIKKKVILKVSDYRSALIQGKFLAKKGIWVSEYRIESGLNCGGHAFATDGFLMGPILEEFKNNRQELTNATFETYTNALKNKERYCPENAPEIKITAQGGVGTSDEHKFLIDYYNIDRVGWGTPFLLVPEVTTVDKHTTDLLVKAKEEDLYLSAISPLGVPFNSLRGNTKDLEKMEWIAKGKPGSSCPKKYLVSNTEFTKRAICSASRQFQALKIKELKRQELDEADYQKAYDKIVDKSCICVGLGTTALLNNDLDRKDEGENVSICPGPNMAYFSKVVSKEEMIGHIYGKNNIISRIDRPNMYVKELTMYIDYLRNKISEEITPIVPKQMRYFNKFRNNLLDGIDYYKRLYGEIKVELVSEFERLENELNAIPLFKSENEVILN
jgi:hypothetical protein